MLIAYVICESDYEAVYKRVSEETAKTVCFGLKKGIRRITLYEEIFIPEEMEKPPKSIVGAVWVRIMNDYGHIDDETPSLAISLHEEYRHLGLGTALMFVQILLLSLLRGFRHNLNDLINQVFFLVIK